MNWLSSGDTRKQRPGRPGRLPKGDQSNPRERMPCPSGSLMVAPQQVPPAPPQPSPLCRAFPSLHLFFAKKTKWLGHFKHRRLTKMKSLNSLHGSVIPDRGKVELGKEASGLVISKLCPEMIFFLLLIIRP